MKQNIGAFQQSGDIEKDAERKLLLHLTAVEQFEGKKVADKVAKHMQGFQLLLDQYKDAAGLSDKAYQALSSDTTDMIAQWD
ncbi:FIMAH domain-containing protein [Oceanobacillus polygoni]|uniref:FIMAH domain-containing protein n=1 Tax=Oceanobacillus polygoni TaxID=1235259 RepID=UPI003B8A8E44